MSIAIAVGQRRSRLWAVPLSFAGATMVLANLPALAQRFPGAAKIATQLPDILLHPAVSVSGNAVALALAIWGCLLLVHKMPREVEMARRLERGGDHQAAAELYLQAGDRVKALELFRKARAWNQAARIALEDGRDREAAHLLRRAGGENLIEAASIFQSMGDSEGATRCAHDLAEWYVQTGRYFEAIEAWYRAGETLRAARAAKLALDEGRLRTMHPSFTVARRAAQEVRDYQLAARLLELEGNWLAAAKAWQREGNHTRAAENFRRSGRLAEAAAAELEAGRPKEAVHARYQQFASLREQLDQAELLGSGDIRSPARQQMETLGTELLPQLEEHGMERELLEVLKALGRIEEAVARLNAADRMSEAADVAHHAGRWDLAAPLLEKLRRWGEASDAFEMAGDLGMAARCAERSGEDERALQLYSALGDRMAAAQCLARLSRLQDGLALLHQEGRVSDACQLLRDHPGPVPDIPDIVLDMAAWLRENESVEQAIACLQRAVLGVALQRPRLEPAVALARLLLQAGDLDASEGQLNRILEYDYAFEPARLLKSEIKAARRSPVATQAAALADGTSPALTATVEQRYEVGNRIGQGGMGVVYLARDKRLERDVAIKVLRTTSPEEAARLEQEAKAAATLSHSGIVTIFDFEAGFGGYFIAMEYVPGEPLDRLLRTGRNRIKENLLHILTQLADAVAYAHYRKVIHRDLKPGNVLLTPANEVKILDFGIAARLDTDSSQSAGVCGTPYYMAPEQIRGEAPTPSSDIYSFGTTAFHLAAGQPPFKTGNVIEAHLSKPPPNPIEFNGDLDPRIAEIILRCLEKAPEDRYVTARELATALQTLRDTASGVFSPAP